MGTITYNGISVEFEERLLAHLHVVIMQRFRRGESFPMSWLDSVASGNGRSSTWMTPMAPISFKFAGSRVAAISADWVAALAKSAASPTGLIVTEEGGGVARAGQRHRAGERQTTRV